MWNSSGTISTMMLSEELLDAYRSTRYRVFVSPTQTFVLRVGQCSAEMQQLMKATRTTGGVFVTACNPFGEPCQAQENLAANARLLTRLQGMTSAVFPGEGISQDGRWREASFLALGVSRAQALSLCQEFSQNAVLYFTQAAEPELLFHPEISVSGVN